MVRHTRWEPVQWAYNRTGTKQEVQWTFMVGTFGSESETFTEETGWELSTGIKLGGSIKAVTFEINASATNKRSFTHTQTSSKGWKDEVTYTLPVEIPEGKSVAAWVLQSRFTLLRQDKTQVSVSVPFNRDTIIFDQYPPADGVEGKNGGRIILEDVLSRFD